MPVFHSSRQNWICEAWVISSVDPREERNGYHCHQQSKCGNRNWVESVGMVYTISFFVGEPGLRNHAPNDRMLAETNNPFPVLSRDHCESRVLNRAHKTLHLIMKDIILEKVSHPLLILGLHRIRFRGRLEMIVLGDKIPNIPLEDRAGIGST